jgi:hypothetical protein
VKPRYQLWMANVLMTVGALPWLLTLAWVGAFFMTAAHGRPPAVPVLDPLGMIGFMGMTFLFALCVAGLGAFWSWVLTYDEQGPASRTARVFRSAVLLALLAPLLVLLLAPLLAPLLAA